MGKQSKTGRLAGNGSFQALVGRQILTVFFNARRPIQFTPDTVDQIQRVTKRDLSRMFLFHEKGDSEVASEIVDKIHIN